MKKRIIFVGWRGGGGVRMIELHNLYPCYTNLFQNWEVLQDLKIGAWEVFQDLWNNINPCFLDLDLDQTWKKCENNIAVGRIRTYAPRGNLISSQTP